MGQPGLPGLPGQPGLPPTSGGADLAMSPGAKAVQAESALQQIIRIGAAASAAAGPPARAINRAQHSGCPALGAEGAGCVWDSLERPESAEIEFAEGTFEVLISDVSLSLMKRTELATRLRGLRPNLWVVFCSGYSVRDGLKSWARGRAA